MPVGKCWAPTLSRSGAVPSYKSYVVYHPVIVLRFDAVSSEIVTVKEDIWGSIASRILGVGSRWK
jgi:hypothetical protein